MSTFKIGKDELCIEPIAAMTSFSLQPIVAPIAGRLLGLMAAVVQKTDGSPLTLEDLEAFAGAGAEGGLASLLKMAPGILPMLGDAIGTLKPQDLKTLLRGLLSGGKKVSTINGVPLFAQDDEPFNTLFAKRTRDIWIILAYAIWENYPDFFPKRVAKDAL